MNARAAALPQRPEKVFDHAPALAGALANREEIDVQVRRVRRTPRRRAVAGVDRADQLRLP